MSLQSNLEAIRALKPGQTHSLTCSNVVGVLWERMYKCVGDQFHAIVCTPGCFSDWFVVKDIEADVRSTLEIIESVRKGK